jgi:hypothetical protein
MQRLISCARIRICFPPPPRPRPARIRLLRKRACQACPRLHSRFCCWPYTDSQAHPSTGVLCLAGPCSNMPCLHTMKRLCLPSRQRWTCTGSTTWGTATKTLPRTVLEYVVGHLHMYYDRNGFGVSEPEYLRIDCECGPMVVVTSPRVLPTRSA